MTAPQIDIAKVLAAVAKREPVDEYPECPSKQSSETQAVLPLIDKVLNWDQKRKIKPRYSWGQGQTALGYFKSLTLTSSCRISPRITRA